MDDLIVKYLFLVLAFVSGFFTCAILTFPHQQKEDHDA